MRSSRVYFLVFTVTILIFSLNCPVEAMYRFIEDAIFTQGDDSQFTGNCEEDHLYTVYTTSDGYVFVPTIISGKLYYAYAALDNDGWYTASDSLVNINQPLPSAYQLDLGEPANTDLDGRETGLSGLPGRYRRGL